MGMFDTLKLVPPVVCPKCGKLHHDTQTKLFDCTLSVLREGAFLSGSPVPMGILKEEVYCRCDESLQEWQGIPIYVVVWHGVYAGHALTEEDGLKRLGAADRLDLLKWLDQAQREAQTWSHHFHTLRNELKTLHEWQNRPQDEPEDNRTLWLYFHLPEEVRRDPDPFARILERNNPKEPSPNAGFDYGESPA